MPIRDKNVDKDASFVEESIALTVTRQLTATVNGIFQYNFDRNKMFLGLSVGARASGGTAPTLTVEVRSVSVTGTLLASQAATAGTPAKNIIATPVEVTKGTNLFINMVIGGTTPTWDDVTAVLYYRPKVLTD